MYRIAKRASMFYHFKCAISSSPSSCHSIETVLRYRQRASMCTLSIANSVLRHGRLFVERSGIVRPAAPSEEARDARVQAPGQRQPARGDPVTAQPAPRNPTHHRLSCPPALRTPCLHDEWIGSSVFALLSGVRNNNIRQFNLKDEMGRACGR